MGASDVEWPTGRKMWATSHHFKDITRRLRNIRLGGFIGPAHRAFRALHRHEDRKPQDLDKHKR